MFSNGRMIEELTTSSDRASCKETRKSSGAGVMLLGSHTLNEYTHKQHIIARSSVEAELYAAALGASETKGIVSLLKDLGYEMCWPLMRGPPNTSSTNQVEKVSSAQSQE